MSTEHFRGTRESEQNKKKQQALRISVLPRSPRPGGASSPPPCGPCPQVAKPINAHNTEWKLSIKATHGLLSFPYLILDCAEDYTTCLVGEPKRSFLSAMTRHPVISEELLNGLQLKAMQHGYDSEKMVAVPQMWDDRR